MLNIAKDTRLGPREALAKAVAFFGPNGQGLEMTEEDDCCVRFHGGGGFVLVRIEDQEETERTRVVVQGREWETQIKAFMRTL